MQINLDEAAFDAMIFDCDGTLVDTAPAHFRAYNEVLLPTGIVFEWEWFKAHTGLAPGPLKLAYEADFGRQIPFTSAEVAEKESALFSRHIHLIQEIEFVTEIARRYSPTIPLAVASSGPRANVVATLQAAGLIDIFKAVVTSEDVQRLKPAPDLFLVAAQRLRVPAARCLVFEDSAEGLAAAHAAQMQSIDIRTVTGPVQNLS
jgi:HAD superfamily hydrolase (TIGR01509 family)